MLVGWHGWWQMRTSLCSTEAVTNFWVDSLLHLPNNPDFVSSDYHLFGPLKAIMMMTGTAECHAHICHTGGKASFTRHEHVLCFTRGRRLLTNVETRLKNNCASRNIIAKVCEMVTCPTCIQHALKSMRHWFLTAARIFQNDSHVFMYNILFFCMLIPHSYLSGFLFPNNSTVCISHLHFQNEEDRFCFVFLFWFLFIFNLPFPTSFLIPFPSSMTYNSKHVHTCCDVRQ